MDDYGASDMRCGDLSASQLKTHFRLADVSTTVDPWTLTRKRLHQAHPRTRAPTRWSTACPPRNRR
nr:DUF3289 family protein [Serratia rubidaea]